VTPISPKYLLTTLRNSGNFRPVERSGERHGSGFDAAFRANIRSGLGGRRTVARPSSKFDGSKLNSESVTAESPYKKPQIKHEHSDFQEDVGFSTSPGLRKDKSSAPKATMPDPTEDLVWESTPNPPWFSSNRLSLDQLKAEYVQKLRELRENVKTSAHLPSMEDALKPLLDPGLSKEDFVSMTQRILTDTSTFKKHEITHERQRAEARVPKRTEAQEMRGIAQDALRALDEIKLSRLPPRIYELIEAVEGGTISNVLEPDHINRRSKDWYYEGWWDEVCPETFKPYHGRRESLPQRLHRGTASNVTFGVVEASDSKWERKPRSRGQQSAVDCIAEVGASTPIGLHEESSGDRASNQKLGNASCASTGRKAIDSWKKGPGRSKDWKTLQETLRWRTLPMSLCRKLRAPRILLLTQSRRSSADQDSSWRWALKLKTSKRWRESRMPRTYIYGNLCDFEIPELTDDREDTVLQRR
jgi:hypothetical protein